MRQAAEITITCARIKYAKNLIGNWLPSANRSPLGPLALRHSLSQAVLFSYDIFRIITHPLPPPAAVDHIFYSGIKLLYRLFTLNRR